MARIGSGADHSQVDRGRVPHAEEARGARAANAKISEKGEHKGTATKVGKQDTCSSGGGEYVTV